MARAPRRVSIRCRAWRCSCRRRAWRWPTTTTRKAVKYLSDLYGIGYLGEKMGVGYRDDFMGPLTMSPNLIREARRQAGSDHQRAHAARQHAGRSCTQAINAAYQCLGRGQPRTVEIDYEQGNWMARDPKGAWLSTLLNIFGDTTGLEAKPVPTAGSTTAKLLPNAINFGPAMPGKKYTAHNAKEYKEVSDLDARHADVHRNAGAHRQS